MSSIPTIRKNIHKQITSWIKTIKDEDLARDLRNNGVMVTGGCITSQLLNEPVNDYDVYLTSPALAARVATYYISEFKDKTCNDISLYEMVEDEDSPQGSAECLVTDPASVTGRVFIKVKSSGIVRAADDNAEEVPATAEQYSDNPEDDGATDEDTKSVAFFRYGRNDVKPFQFRPLVLTDNAITLSDDLQIIIRFAGPAEEIHKNFDFVHCTCYYLYNNLGYGSLVLPPEAVQSILTRSLVYRGSLFPVASLFRLRKFIRRGWTINAGQVLKIAYQISKLNLDDVSTLREQLIGVDVVYMNNLIDKLQNNLAEDDTGYGSLGDYLYKLIDEIFE